MGLLDRRTAKVVMAVIIVIVVVLAALLFIPGKSSHRISWTTDLDGSLPMDVRVTTSGTVLVWTTSMPATWRWSSDFYGIAQNGTVNWHRTYYNVQTATYGGMNLMIVGGMLEWGSNTSYIIGFDEYNRTKMSIDCGNVTLTSLAPSADQGMFAVMYSHDNQGPHGTWSGQYWLKKYFANGTVQWERPWSDMQLKYMMNGTLLLTNHYAVMGLEKETGNISWTLEFPGISAINLVTYDAIYGVTNDSRAMCYNLDGSVRWSQPINVMSTFGFIGIDTEGTSYLSGMSTTSQSYLVCIEPNGSKMDTVLLDGFPMLTGLRHGAAYVGYLNNQLKVVDNTGNEQWSLKVPSGNVVKCWYSDTWDEIFVTTGDSNIPSGKISMIEAKS